MWEQPGGKLAQDSYFWEDECFYSSHSKRGCYAVIQHLRVLGSTSPQGDSVLLGLESTAPAKQGAEHVPFSITTLYCRETKVDPEYFGSGRVAMCTAAIHLQEDCGSLTRMLRCVYRPLSSPALLAAQHQNFTISAPQGINIQMSV